MFRVLIPVDFSPDSENFVEAGFRVLPKVDEAAFLYVIPLGMRELEDFVDQESIRNAKEKAEEKMAQFIKRLKIKADKITHAISDGDPARAIVDLANSGKFDAVLVGHRGYAYLEEFFIGSVTLKLISNVNIPVIVVKKGKKGGDLLESE
ncbi:MAG: universal stress protein [Thermoplasmatales archaeon]